MLNSRERLTRCFFHQETDRPAVTVWENYPANDPTYEKTRAYVSEHCDRRLTWWCGREVSCVEPLADAQNTIERRYPCMRTVEPHSEDFERIIRILKTPKGELKAIFLRNLKGQPGLAERHFIQSREDAEKFLSLSLPTIEPETDPFFEMDLKIGERGVIICWLGFNPAGFVVELLGSENFALFTRSDRDILHALCERQMKIMLATAKHLLVKKIGPFFSLSGEEYLVPPLHGPGDFKDFNLKYDKPIVDLVHNGGARMYVHSHGSMKKVLKGFVDAGVDVLHPIEAPPMGDITPAEAKKIIRGKICMEGNIQIARFYEATPDEIREETLALIRDVFDDRRGLIVCPTASAFITGAGETCFPQYRTMIDAVRNWRSSDGCYARGNK
ncbi:MAG: hypothetical protein HY360_08050 [Verrucomicrobia bacterium]|nr:hypothetical protein [Verrucomicrobiota bacterium]